MVVKPPLVSQCQRLPIRGCGELVDGVLLHVDGDETNARLKVEQVLHQNGPGQLKPFARVLRDTAKAPGVEDYAEQLLAVAEWIDPDETLAAKAARPLPGSPAIAAQLPAAAPPAPTQPNVAPTAPFRRDESATRALSASADPLRLVTETIDFSGAPAELIRCRLAGLEALCLTSREGPLIITDIIQSQACGKRLFVGASISDTPDFGMRWLVEAGATPLTGARLLVRGGDWLQFAMLQDKKRPESTECRITWSAFQPWIVTR
jgi:hypothetical protein